MSTQTPRTPPGHKPRGLLTAFLDLPNDSTVKTLIVALLLCLVCSALVSTAAVRLKPLQVANQELDKKLNILEATGLLRDGTSPDALFEQQITARVVDLASWKGIPARCSEFLITTSVKARAWAARWRIPTGRPSGKGNLFTTTRGNPG